MPTISLFYGISIQMFYEDHPPPHIHARYNEFKARYDIASGACSPGNCLNKPIAWCRIGLRSGRTP